MNRLVNRPCARRLVQPVLGIDRRRKLPSYEYPTFRAWFDNRPAPDANAGGQRIAYFYGCFTNVNEVDVGKAAVALLEAHGFKVMVNGLVNENQNGTVGSPTPL